MKKSNKNQKKGVRIFVIGDIHGCAQTFWELLFEKLRINNTDIIYLLGDYIDRGPKSKEVIDIILKLKKKGYLLYPLMGNHEKLLLNSSSSRESLKHWILRGGKPTLKSFGVSTASKIEKKYIRFFKTLPYYYKTEKYILVHGGLNFDIPNPLKDKESMVWIRNNYVDRDKIKGRKLIVGHKPKTLNQIKKSLKNDNIMLDGGCVYKTRYKSMGNLCALELNSMKLYYQKNIDF
jgi:serine/threonine protein phosphatase 1